MFQGFSERTSSFFWDLSFNNERPWFKEHKAEFDACIQQPLKALTQDVAEGLNELYPQYDWQQHVSRIYRDARRLYGRGPFRDHMWSDFYRVGAAQREPGFWFGISAREYSWGMGFWDTTPDLMEHFRKAVEANPARFERIVTPLSKNRHFRVYGDSYKRPKGDMGPLLNPWYNCKSFSVGCSRDFGPELYDPELSKKILADYQKLMPLYCWLLELFGPADGPGPNWGL